MKYTDYLKAVSDDGFALVYVPEDMKDYKICMVAAQNTRKVLNDNRTVLEVIPNHLRTREICELVVKKDGRALKDVPMSLRDRQMCLDAVSNHGEALMEVPKELKDFEVCMTALIENSKAAMSIPIECMCKELAMQAIRGESWMISWMPRHLIDVDLFLRFCENNNFANYLDYIPDEIIDKAMER